MRTTVYTAALILIATLTAYAQQHVTCSPSDVQPGGVVRFTYDASAKEAVLKAAKNIAAEVMEFTAEGSPAIRELPLKRSGRRWSGSIKLVATTVLYQLRFVGDEKIDDNGENVWMNSVVGQDGNPVHGSDRVRAGFLLYSGVPGFKVTRDPEMGLKLFAQEAERSPKDWKAQSAYWNALMRTKSVVNNTMQALPPDVQKTIGTRLGSLHAELAQDEEAMASLIPWYGRIGEQAKGDSLRAAAIAEKPNGLLAKRGRQSALMMERDPKKRIVLFDSFMKDFPLAMEERNTLESQLIVACIQAGEYARAFTAIDAATHLEVMVGSALNDVAWKMAETNGSLDTAAMIAKRSIDLGKDGKKVAKPAYLSNRDWEKSTKYSLGMVLDTYGYILTKQGKHKEASASFEEAVKCLEGKEAEINERYVASLVETKSHTEAMNRAAEFIRTGTSTDGLVALYKKAYVGKNGSDKGFDALLAKGTTAAKEASQASVAKEMIDKPPIPFALKDLNGVTVTLESLRGKVVVVDFWATWCGPCKSSFPFLQKVYEKYQSNPKVAILAFNTWENKKGQEREEMVKKFMADNKYTFPVLYDDGIVEKFGVEGIPTKFILDGKGRIRFKSVGFGGGEKMIGEMTAQIDLLLNAEDAKSGKK